MQAESSTSFEQQVLTRLDKLDTDVNALKTDIDSLKVAWLEANTKVEAYQKAFTQVINLAFALISAATATVIISAVLGR